MKKISFTASLILVVFFTATAVSQNHYKVAGTEFLSDSIFSMMHRVNDHFLDNTWKNNDRNWIRGTYYTGLMTFYKVTKGKQLFDQAKSWAQKHGWRTGTDWTYPPNRLTCSQTYLQIYFHELNPEYIKRTRSFMDKKINNTDPAKDQGWDYVDALYVGIPAYMMMGKATGEQEYIRYANRIFWEVVDDLYDREHHLFYRDEKAKKEKSKNDKPVFWSRGNGWAIASIPRILEYLPEENEYYPRYVELLEEMATSLSACQSEDGFWRTNLADPEAYSGPESSGTAFFTYALAWGINNGILKKDKYLPVVAKAWKALYNVVDEDGKVCYGQGVSRDPGHVDKEDSQEYVAGAFLLAGSEVFRLQSSDDFKSSDE